MKGLRADDCEDSSAIDGRIRTVSQQQGEQQGRLKLYTPQIAPRAAAHTSHDTIHMLYQAVEGSSIIRVCSPLCIP